MWFLKNILNILLLSSFVYSSNIETSFKLAGQGYGDISIKNSKRFITSYDKNYYVFTIEGLDTNLTKKIDECLETCDNYSSCNGVFFGLNRNNYFKKCIGLSYLGRLGRTNTFSLSYTKIRKHNFENKSHYISGIVHNDLELGNIGNVYLDLNLNHKYENNEPLLIPNENGYYEFTNLKSNYYSVNQYLTHSCIQNQPSFNSQYFEFKYNGYPSSIVKYYDSGFGMMSGEKGGYLHGALITELKNLNGIAIKDIVINIEPNMLVNNNIKYSVFIPEKSYIDFSFKYHYLKNVSINVNFLNEINSDDHASIYVSQDNLNYVYVGDIKSKNDTLLVSDPNFLVQFIRIEGLSSNGLTRGFPFVSLYVNSSIEYSSEFSNLVHFENNKDYLSNVNFFNKCDFQLECNDYCKYIYGNKTNYELVSCYNGCDLFLNSNSCSCENYRPCYHGCYYNLEKLLYPEYSLYHNNYSAYFNLYNNMLECSSSSCLLDAVGICNKNVKCKLILYNGLKTYYFYDYYLNHTFNKKVPENFEFLVKNIYLLEKNFIDDTSTLTSTSTSTSSLTSTSTSSLTSTSTSTSSLTSTSTSTSSLTSTSTSTSSLTSTTTSISKLTTISCVNDNCFEEPNTNVYTTTKKVDEIVTDDKDKSSTLIIILASTISVVVFISIIVTSIVCFIKKRNRLRRDNTSNNDDNNLSVSFQNPIFVPPTNLNIGYPDIVPLVEPDNMEESNI